MLFISTLLIRHAKHSNSAFYLLLAQLSTASHFLGFTPELFELPNHFRLALRLLDTFQIVFIWFFALSLFDKNFKLNIFHLSIALIYSFCCLMERAVIFDFIDILPSWWALLINSMSVLIVIHMVSATLLGRRDDLIESRRKSRVYFVLMIAFSVLSVTIFGSILFNQYQATIDVIGIWPAIVWGAYWLCFVPSKVFSFDVGEPEQVSSMSARDVDLQKRLNIEVLEKQCFLENDLSIESLAKRLGVSEYRLRCFINKTLGHTNFSTYINAYRIEGIKKELSNSEKSHIPILTIAMNHGFNSLSPFNRAFKQVEGMTPSEFRQNLRAAL